MCSLAVYCPSYRGRESLSGRGATEVGEARPVTGGGGRIAMATDETSLVQQKLSVGITTTHHTKHEHSQHDSIIFVYLLQMCQ